MIAKYLGDAFSHLSGSQLAKSRFRQCLTYPSNAPKYLLREGSSVKTLKVTDELPARVAIQRLDCSFEGHYQPQRERKNESVCGMIEALSSDVLWDNYSQITGSDMMEAFGT